MNQAPDFVPIAYLHAKTSRAGRRLLFGRVGSLRLYAFVQEHRAPKDGKADYVLCLRREDFQRLKDNLPVALAQAAPEREHLDLEEAP